jgi:uncharacterized membrane protein
LSHIGREARLTLYLGALTLGFAAGLRTMSAVTAITLAAWMGGLDVSGTWLAFMGSSWMPWVIVPLAIGELIADKLPSTPSRKEPVGFGARLVSGAVSGAALGGAYGSAIGGLLAGVAGAVTGTLVGHAFRSRLAAAIGRDRPAALIEDALAYTGAALVVLPLP